MGDIADEHIERMLDEGHLFIYTRRSEYVDPWCVTCKYCGMQHLRWRTNEAGTWQLYENKRVEHNRLKEHVCPQGQPTADGFDHVD